MHQQHTTNISHQANHLALVRSSPVGRSEWVPPDRCLHLSDVENLMGGPRSGIEALAEARARYEAVVPIGPADHVIAACNPRLVHDAAAVWRPSRWLTRRGQNGADLALLGAVDAVDVARRFRRVVVGSGDGAFAPLAEELRALGVEVWAAARPGSLDYRLGHAVHVIALLRSTPPVQAQDDCASNPEPEAA